MKRSKPFIFNPAEESKESLIANFVIRTDVFQKIISGIKHSDPEVAPQHYLIVGQRGMGKTTLLLRLQYEVENTPTLSRTLNPIRFSEEQYNINNLISLWEETAVVLSTKSTECKDLYDNMLVHESEDDYEEVCFTLLEQYAKKTGRRIFYLIDNVGKLFDRFTDKENRRLREILMTSPHILLVGGSAEMLEHTHSYDKPFFEFFYQFKLEPLAKKDTIKLMKTLAARYDVANKIAAIIKNAPQRIEALRRITGGVPRTMVLLFEILADSDNGAAFEDLETLTDRVTALYGQRMENLKPQQQKIVDALARAWEPLTAAEILQQSKLYREGLATNQLSSQLGQMDGNQLVETLPSKGRTKRYRIRERFFNIWYLMRYGRQEVRQQVLWLVRFLETWCTIEELQDVAYRQIDCLSNGTYYSKAAYYKAVAMHEIEGVNAGTKKKLLKTTEEYLRKQNQHDWANNVHKLYETITQQDLLAKAIQAIEEKNIKQAESYFGAIEDDNVHILCAMGIFYHFFKKDNTKAEQFYLRAIDKGGTEVQFKLAQLYEKMKKISKAEEFYLKAIENGDVEAFFRLGIIYSRKGDTQKAKRFYLKAIEQGSIDALVNLGNLYSDKNEFEKAEEFYLKAVARGDVNALFNLGNLFHDKGDIAKAEKSYLEAISKGDIDSLYNIGNLYREKGDMNKAEEYYLRAAKNNKSGALNNLGGLYTEMGRLEEAETFYQKAIAKKDDLALRNLGILYERQENFKKAEEKYLTYFKIKNREQDAAVDLVRLYFKVGKHTEALNYANIFFNKDTYNDLNALMSVSLAVLVFGQYNFLLNKFNAKDSSLKKHILPFYYALAYFIKEQMPGEYEKASPEIAETVEEIIYNVMQLRSENEAIVIAKDVLAETV